MPNGGVRHCGHCQRYSESRCGLRDVPIESPRWTTCRNINRSGTVPVGPLYAIVCEVKDQAAMYDDIPYFDGIRVDTARKSDGGDTVVCFTDGNGDYHEFASIADYLLFYKESGRPY